MTTDVLYNLFMKVRTYEKATAVIFLVIAVLHLFRILDEWTASVNGWDVPMWISTLAFVIAAYFSYQGFQLSKK